MQQETNAAKPPQDLGFFRGLATVMALVQVSGFVVQLAMGRSSFDAPLIIHLHAVAAMGWVAIFALQAWFAAGGAKGLHRTLGVLALVWAIAFVALGVLVTLNTAHAARVPFFFQPQHFLIANPATAIAFLALVLAAVALRRTDWHPRLHIGAFVLVMGPSFGRLLPMPLLAPYAFEIAVVAPLVFILAGMIYDLRARGRIHPAWIAPVVVAVLVIGGARLIAFSPLGASLYAMATAGGPAAGLDGLAFPPPPPPP